jgi:hypothetical protein
MRLQDRDPKQGLAHATRSDFTASRQTQRWPDQRSQIKTGMTKAITFALITAGGVTTGGALNPTRGTAPQESSSAAVSNPNEKAPLPKPPVEDATYFCCDSVSNGKNGEGCEEIPRSHVVLCDKVLKCPDGYSKDEGKVTCA